MSNTKHWRLMRSASFLLLFVVPWACRAQQQLADTLVKRFSRYQQQTFQEKIYVHVDRTNFLTGETIWFRIYCVDASLHRASDVSKVAYLEILDDANQAVLQAKVELTGGLGSGSLFVPATLNTGNFIVRAYTSWMKNLDPAFFFHQPITIINAFKKPELATPGMSAKYDAQFLPEGGTLLTGTKTKIAFRVTDENGRGVNFRGVVLNDHHDTIIHFKPEKFGIGHFWVTPSAQHTYRIIVKSTEGSKLFTYPFPEVSPVGYHLQITDSSSENLNVLIRTTTIAATSVSVYLLVHTRNQLIFARSIPLLDNKATLDIAKNLLAEGISHFTLFTEALQPVCERLYFKVPDNKLNIQIRSDQREYGKRKKVTLTLETTDQQHKPVQGNISISISKADSLSFANRRHVQSYLMLTSDLKGEIESPEYYFNGDAGKKAIDNIMLTHGWRRFSWETIVNQTETIHRYLPENRGHIVQVNIHDQNGVPASGVKTFLASPSKLIRVYGSFSDKRGQAKFITKDLLGPRKIIVQNNWQRDSVYTLSIENPFARQFASVTLPSVSLHERNARNILERSIAMQVHDIYHGNKMQPTGAPLPDSSAFYGIADETYLLDDYTRFPVMEEVMREYVPGVWVRKRDGKFVFMVLDNPNQGLFKEQPLVLVDGVPVFEVDKVMAFDPLKVKKLEVVTRKFFMGELIFAGIVSYSTYTGDLAGFQSDRKSLIIDYEGLQATREFYSPRYTTRQEYESRIPDQRNLLFWDPDVVTTDGKAEIEFYTSDLTGEYHISVEGITPMGKAGSFSGSISVKALDY